MTSAMSRLAPPTCSTYQSITVIDDLHQRSTQPSTRWLQPATRLKNHALASRRRSNQSIRMPTISAKSSPDRDQRTKAIAQTVQSESIPAGDYYPGSNAWQTVKQDEWQGEMEVQGEIPSWLDGTYLRNGPGYFEAGGKEFPHLFDGYSTLIRLNFNNSKLIAHHAQLQSEAYKAVKSSGKVSFREFAVTPKHNNVFEWMGEVAGIAMGTTLTDNANTGVIKLGDGRVVCLTETCKGSIQINPDTLETIGQFKYTDNLGGLIHAAHPYVDENEMITLLPDLLNPGYTAVRMVAGTNERVPIGRVNCNGPQPGWVHSFAVTENYIVVPEGPLRYSVRNLLKAEEAEYFKFEWLPESGAWIHIMDRFTGKIVTCVEVPNFVTFHFINGYEDVDENGKPQIIVDCCEHHADPVILKRMKLNELRSYPGKVLPDARVGRFTIPLDGSKTGTLTAAVPIEEHGAGLDMNTINPVYTSKKYRYVYACGASRPCNFPNTLTKIDLETKTAKNWHHPGGIPTEPFFVPRPGATEEDDGVLISLVSDDSGGGFILILNGSDFTELARADLPYGLPYGLHGCWVPGQSSRLRI
uniref:Carotenoid cleavage dioxygenase 8 n=1 Tax=Physcomitrium patens TaxID=3218 RepID=E2EZQ2_PHYPA|nr:carotenoid cleavage dioxygenase 8 [Physcomitrium patens]